MSEPLLTIFTPTYNRAHTLPRLFDSLKAQTSKNFEWLVINDGSTDNTSEWFCELQSQEYGFDIRYEAVSNGGKNRAINRALKEASGKYFMILDSDDMLVPDAVEFICAKMLEVEGDDCFIGISGKKADLTSRRPLGVVGDYYSEDGYVDCNNLERSSFGLLRDMAEVFFTEKLRRYEFKVWKGEKFTPEEVVWNQMALDGYKLRWYNRITYLCEYQQDGLTGSAWRLLRDNPMGYAMMWNHRLLYCGSDRDRIKMVIQHGACCILGKEWKEIFSCRNRLLATGLLPFSMLLSIKRKRQIKKFT